MIKYFRTEPVKDQIPIENRFFFLQDASSFSLNEGKKAELINKLQVDSYIDMGNTEIELDDFTNEIKDRIYDEGIWILYEIEPVNAKLKGDIINKEQAFVSSFVVKKIMTNINELLVELSKHDASPYNGVYSKLFSKIFNMAGGSNDDLELAKECFSYNKENGLKEIYLRSIIMDWDAINYCIKSSSDKLKSFAEYLVKNGYVSLVNDFDDHVTIIKALLSAKWFSLAYQYAECVCKDKLFRKIFFKDIKEDKQFTSLLTNSYYDESVRKMVDLIGIKIPISKLEIIERDSEGRITSSKISFPDIDKLKTYVVRNYKVSCSTIMREPAEWGYENISFRIY